MESGGSDREVESSTARKLESAIRKAEASPVDETEVKRLKLEMIEIDGESKAEGESSIVHENEVERMEMEDAENSLSDDIDRYIKAIEAKARPLADYMEKTQQNINAKMRSALVDWFVEEAQTYALTTDTICVAVLCLDRFLSENLIQIENLQLLGIVCLLIASKYEEASRINPLHPRIKISEYYDVAGLSYTRDDLNDMEIRLLESLNHEIGYPTVKTFLSQFMITAVEDYEEKLKLEFLACYLAELSQLDYDFVKFLPSVVAASAVFLSRFTLQPMLPSPWSLALKNKTGYRAADLKECICILHCLHLSIRDSTLVALPEKYKQHEYKRVSLLTPPTQVPLEIFNITEY